MSTSVATTSRAFGILTGQKPRSSAIRSAAQETSAYRDAGVVAKEMGLPSRRALVERIMRNGWTSEVLRRFGGRGAYLVNVQRLNALLEGKA